jgi:hypothetical protein
MHAVDGEPQPLNIQAITWCFPLAYDPGPGANHVIDEPEQWHRWRDYIPKVHPAWPVKMLSWLDPAPWDVSSLRHNYLFPDEKPPLEPGQTRGGSRWHYRRILHAAHYAEGLRPHEVTLVNWPHNDYIEGGLIDVSREEHDRTMLESKQLSLALLYWLQTEAPNYTTGQTGYPGLYLRPDLVDTADGLAMFPYIRESRRIRAVFTVTENHVGTEARLGRNFVPGRDAWASLPGQAEKFADSVGVGSYRIDLHISTGGDNYIDISSLPFQIPLGSLLPVRVRNLLAACKNLGVTHLTNGCYRLHPVEWNIGESAGLLAAYCLRNRTEPHAVREDPEQLKAFQSLLTHQGVELDWPQTHAI